MSCLLKPIALSEIRNRRRSAVDESTLETARAIVTDVRDHGEPALRAHAVRLGDIGENDPLVCSRDDLGRALSLVDQSMLALLDRTAGRIRTFAEAQRRAISDVQIAIPGGEAGHRVVPVRSAGCYAPGGRYPLPSSVLMTVVTARTAGVGTIWVASPRPAPITKAAAFLAGADGLLAAGGAQSIAALAFGAGPVPPCDIVAGPGNRWVTAAKSIVSTDVGIDMLAGPSELLIVADGSADPALVAADLLAQAEHDADAVPMLVSLDDTLAARVEVELVRQLRDLPAASTALKALENGFVVSAGSIGEAAVICDSIAPEHLQLMIRDDEALAGIVRCYGTIFIGHAAEVAGDYGAGPNHVLPTGGTARFSAGLSVLTFLKMRTWLRIDDAREASGIFEDAASLARAERLEAHARAADRRSRS